MTDKIEITPAFLSALKAKAEKAMPGPWELDETPTDIATYYEIYSTDWMVADCEKDGASATFIAAANPAVVLALIEKIVRLEEEAATLACFCADICPHRPRVDCQVAAKCPYGAEWCRNSEKPETWHWYGKKRIENKEWFQKNR